MITLNASGGSVTFTFSGNSTYLNDGTIEVPVNSLALIIDESDMATFRKAASNDIFVSANIAEFGMTKDELIAWYKENMVGSTGGGGGVTTGEVQTMIDESISGKVDTDSLSAYTINEGIASSSQTYDVEISSTPTDVHTLDKSYEGLRVYKVNNYSTCYLIGYDENDTEIGRIYFSPENPTIVDTTGFTDVIINRERISDSASTAIVEGKELTAIKKFSFYSNYWDTDEETSVYFYNKAYNVTDAIKYDLKKLEGGNSISIEKTSSAYIISSSLPISAGTGNDSVQEGRNTVASGVSSHAEGYLTNANGQYAHAEGSYTIANNQSEHASGYWNVSNTGESTSAQTLFSVGNGAWDGTLQETVRHNAFEIRQNGDIYFFDGTNDVKLQDVISNILNRLTTIENNS